MSKGRDDYLTWTELGGLGGYLNVRDRTEALPKWVDQGSDKSIATGVGVDWRLCRLADFTGDGKVSTSAFMTTSYRVKVPFSSNDHQKNDAWLSKLFCS